MGQSQRRFRGIPAIGRKATGQNRLGRRARFEQLEARQMLAAQPLLSEFVASNDSTINDGFGDDSDWLEIRNAGDAAIDLQGYHLTDNASNTTKWMFTESTVLDPGEYLVVFASSEDTIDPLGYWHTNFKLSASGEYLGLADPAGTIISEFDAGGTDFPPQLTDVSYGTAGASEQSLFTEADDVVFRVPRNNALGTVWTTIGFDTVNNGFVTSPGGVGYENDPGALINYNSEINSNVPSGTTTAYIRHEFNLASASAVTDLTLSLKYDDGFVAYLNGTLLFSDNAPATLAYNSTATGGRSDGQVLAAVDFSLNDHLALLEDGDNVLAIHALNLPSSSDMLLRASLTAQVETGGASTIGYLASATPGGPNTERIDLGPIIREVDFSPELVAANAPIIVTAEVSSSVQTLNASSVRLHYRRMFGAETTLVMTDDGLGADSEAGDGVFSAQIPGITDVGEMIRWHITAEDTEGTVSRAPRFADPLDSAEYFGAVVLDPNASSDLPVMYWFVENEAAAATRTGTRASLYYLGDFYDNIQVDLHGQSTAGADFPKKSFDFDSNKGEKFKIAEGLERHSDFNLLTNYADQSKLRNTVAYAAFAEAGAAHHLAYPVAVHRNGEFYALYDFVEDGDAEYLERIGLDPDGALYKVNNNLENNNSANFDVDKKTRKYEDRSDLEELVQADDLTGLTATRWDYDNLDIPTWVNYLAMQSVVANGDFGHKNQYFYRDSNNTLLWQVLPWDLDLSFGHQWIASTSPPYFDNRLFTQSSLFNGFNDIVQRLYQEPNFREMYFRRLRTLSDQILGTPGTPVSESWAYQQFELWDNVTADEAIQNTAEWGIHPNFTRTPAQAVDQIQNDYISARRNYITSRSGIPSAQNATLNVTIDPLQVTPGEGVAAEHYFVLRNNENTAADISGWTIEGAVNHMFKPGTIIPAGDQLYVVADVQGFQNRSTGPRGGLALMTQGNYDGALSRFGGTLTLSNADQTPISQLTYEGTTLPGDYNADGTVDGADYTVWRAALGSTTDLAADGNGNNVVDEADYKLWRSNYGATAAASSLAVPPNSTVTSFVVTAEPATVVAATRSTESPFDVLSRMITPRGERVMLATSPMAAKNRLYEEALLLVATATEAPALPLATDNDEAAASLTGELEAEEADEFFAELAEELVG